MVFHVPLGGTLLRLFRYEGFTTAIPGATMTSGSIGADLAPGGLRKRESLNPSRIQGNTRLFIGFLMLLI